MENYELGKTGIPTMDQIRRHIQIFMEQERLDGPTWQNVLLMTLLLRQYEALERLEVLLVTMEEHLSSMSHDSWNDHHNK